MRSHIKPSVKAIKAYRYLRAAIANRRLEPGTYVREERLAAELQISRTPIREALRQLERDGHVKLVPHAGAQVREVSVQDLFEALSMRRYLEPHAASIAAGRIEPATEARLHAIRRTFERAAEAEPSREVVSRHKAADRRLHALILDLAGNRRMAQVITNLIDTIQSYRYLGLPNRLRQTAQDHIDIVDALLRHDPVAAGGAMARHLDRFTEDMQRLLIALPESAAAWPLVRNPMTQLA